MFAANTSVETKEIERAMTTRAKTDSVNRICLKRDNLFDFRVYLFIVTSKNILLHIWLIRKYALEYGLLSLLFTHTMHVRASIVSCIQTIWKFFSVRYIGTTEWISVDAISGVPISILVSVVLATCGHILCRNETKRTEKKENEIGEKNYAAHWTTKGKNRNMKNHQRLINNSRGRAKRWAESASDKRKKDANPKY